MHASARGKGAAARCRRRLTLPFRRCSRPCPWRNEMEELFVGAARVLGLLIEAAAVLVVAFGAGEAFLKLLRVVGTPGTSRGVAQGDLAEIRCMAAARPRVRAGGRHRRQRVLTDVAGGRQAGRDRRHPDVLELLPEKDLGEAERTGGRARGGGCRPLTDSLNDAASDSAGPAGQHPGDGIYLWPAGDAS